LVIMAERMRGAGAVVMGGLGWWMVEAREVVEDEEGKVDGPAAAIVAAKIGLYPLSCAAVEASAGEKDGVGGVVGEARCCCCGEPAVTTAGRCLTLMSLRGKTGAGDVARLVGSGGSGGRGRAEMGGG